MTILGFGDKVKNFKGYPVKSKKIIKSTIHRGILAVNDCDI
tara:strand:+ start:2648 stop:2770 length:123 start_codon:yes stop_codon:yes gene_type:complete